MAKIILDEKYHIRDDGIGYTLLRNDGKFTKDNKPYYTIISYPSTIESAIRWYIRDSKLDFEGTIIEYIDMITNVIKSFSNPQIEVKLKEVKNG